MQEKDKKKIIELYEKRLEDFGVDVKTVGWRSTSQQNIRFEFLSQIGDLKGKKILDLGCGFADLYVFLKKKGVLADYYGYDLSPKIIEKAKGLHPELRQRLFVKDILNEKTDEKFDYVLSSGILNAKISNNMSFAKEIIKKCFDICKIGVAINMTSDYVDYMADTLFYYSPEEIFKFCKGLSKRVTLRHDYMPYEFTVYLYKDDRINPEHIFVKAMGD